jgi:hypothetical protein
MLDYRDEGELAHLPIIFVSPDPISSGAEPIPTLTEEAHSEIKFKIFHKQRDIKSPRLPIPPVSHLHSQAKLSID